MAVPQDRLRLALAVQPHDDIHLAGIFGVAELVHIGRCKTARNQPRGNRIRHAFGADGMHGMDFHQLFENVMGELLVVGGRLRC